MDLHGSSGHHHPRQERGRGSFGPDRRVRRGARNIKGGSGGDPAVKFRNKTWRREGTNEPQSGDRQADGQASEVKGETMARSTFGTFSSGKETNVPFGGNTNGTNGFAKPPAVFNGTATTFGVSPFGTSAFGGSVFAQSAFSPSATAFSTNATSTPPKRNAFGAVIDSPVSTFGQSRSDQLKPPSSVFGSTSQPMPGFANSASFGTGANPISVFGSPQSSNLNAAAPSFTPGSTFGTTPASVFASPVTTSPFSDRQEPKGPKSAFGPSGLGTPQSLTSPMNLSATRVKPISASALEGGHIPTTRHRSERSRWKSRDLSSLPTPAQPSQDIPPYQVPPNIQREIDQGKYATDNRFPGNRFLELKALRPSMRVHSIKHKLISDPEHRTDLTGAITVLGTCMDMCPEFERHEREFQKDVDDWEKIPGTNPKRIDHRRAVKKYRRSAAGNDEPLESDLRPPSVLKMTLDYLFYELLDKHGLEATYAFIRDRTRAIRTDFTIQHEKGPIAVECFERIARFHILAVHRFCERDDVRGFDYWQEVEQMMKTLQSLIQFYDDNEGKIDSPNEAEFRSYYILAHIRDTNSMRRLQALAPSIFLDPVLQTALEFRSYAQRNTHIEKRSTSHRAAKLKFRNSEACLNAFTRFFKRVRHQGTSYLMGCLLEYHFGGVRKGAIHALWKAYTARHRPLPTADLMDMLGVDNEEKSVEVARRFGMAVVDENGESGGTAAVQLNKNSKFDYANQMTQRHSVKLVEVKGGDHSDVDIVDGKFDKAAETWTQAQLEVPSALAPTPVETPTTQPRKPSIVMPPPRSVSSTITFPPPSGPSPSLQAPPPAPWGVFNQMVAAQPSPVTSSNMGPFFKAQDIPNSTVTASPTHAPLSNQTSVHIPVPPHAPWPTSAFGPQSPLSSFPSPARRTESVFTPPMRSPRDTPAPPPIQLPIPTEVRHSPPQVSPVRKEVPALSPAKEASPEATQPHVVKPASPPRPTQEEILFQQQQAARHALALAQARADRHFRFHLFFNVFTHWKRSAMNRGHIRELRKDREEQFKRSIKDMGLSTNSPVSDRKGKQKVEYYDDEDLISWEDTSQASSSTSVRRRRRKSLKRADDEATLVAIKEAEATRLRLWERGTFLTSISHHIRDRDHLLFSGGQLPHGWQVWLSTTSSSLSTAEWLRLKFNADNCADPGLDRIPLPNAGATPPGCVSSPGIIIFDITALDEESAIQADVQRLRNLILSLPPNRHYVPSILLLQWTESSLPSRISSELRDFEQSKTIGHWEILSFANDGRHFDDQFSVAIANMPLDIAGRRIERASLDSIFQTFFGPWDAALNHAIDRCQVDPDSFDWTLYAKVITVMIESINSLAAEVLHVCQIEKSPDRLPVFDGSTISNQPSAFDTFMGYLNMGWLASNQDALLLRTELSSDASSGRDFYVRAVPERLAHLTLCTLRSAVPPNSIFYLDVKSTPDRVASFAEGVHASLAQLERRVVPQSSISKKRSASGNFNGTTHHQLPSSPEAKRRKHDVLFDAVNGKPSTPNGHPPRQDTLSRLRATVAKAQRSVEDLRSERSGTERSLSPSDDGANLWHDASSPDMPSRESPAQGDRISNGRGPTFFDPNVDLMFSLIPSDAMEVIPARSTNELLPSMHYQASSLVSSKTLKVTHVRDSPHFHPYLNGGAGNGLAKSWARPSSRIQRGAASLTPRATGADTRVEYLARLKEDVQRAKQTVEESRRAREASEGLLP